ncbi:MAG TPA: PQQ-dependent sugar dehydrogenase [Chloroflexia bacterium]|nr:PQQ-dependent sugar dehydrogenase [Chloroflexia bacterium]
MNTRRNRRLVLLVGLLVLAGLLVWRPNSVLGLITRPFGISVDVGGGNATSIVVPDGFEVNIYASGLRGPRLLDVGPDGTLFVAERDAGRVAALPDKDGDGRADGSVTVADGLSRPNSVFVYSGTLIVGEQGQVSMLRLGQDYKATERTVLVPDLPSGGIHNSKTAVVGSDGRLYVAMGSTCNVCDESDERRAAVSVYGLDGAGGTVFAKGLRNAVGLALNPWTGEVWASNNGRDLMGDDLPPETVYALKEGGDYGWPRCYAGDIPDPDFGKSGDACAGVEAPVVRMAAHMAPLGIAFYKGGNFPAPYNDSLYIALHGSWNSSSKVGYKVMRVPLSEGRVAGDAVDFATGFLSTEDVVTGRPAGVAVGTDGSLFISDDKSGFIYKVSWRGK